MLRSALSAAALCALTHTATHVRAQVECDKEGSCTYSATYKGSTVSFDFRRLCNGGADYTFYDAQGHTYYAQICGLAAKRCLPHNYETEYEYGRIIQSWGSPPPCDNECVDERTRQPTCCTEDCEVVGVRSAAFSLIDPNNIKNGVRLTYIGATPTQDDQYSCPKDPATGTPYPRISHMEFYCDANADGFAHFYEVDQNATNGCDYTLKFKTSLVCVNDLTISGGWIFCILVFTSFALYAIVGTLWTYKTQGIWAFPNRHFWAELHSLVFDGVVFIAFCGRKGSSASNSAKPSKEDARPLFSNADGAAAGFQAPAPAAATGKRDAYTEL